MDQSQPSRDQAENAAAICAHCDASEEALALLKDDMKPRAYLDALIGAELHVDALRFLAHAMPAREAVWWACQCVSGALKTPTPASDAALEAARAWVADPKDPKRRASFQAAEAADLGTPAGCLAASVFFSGGSIAPPDQPAVEPPAHVCGKMIAGSVILAAVIEEPEKSKEKYTAFLRIGLEVADGRRPCPQAPREPAAPVAPAGRAGASTHGTTRRPRY